VKSNITVSALVAPASVIDEFGAIAQFEYDSTDPSDLVPWIAIALLTVIADVTVRSPVIHIVPLLFNLSCTVEIAPETLVPRLSKTDDGQLEPHVTVLAVLYTKYLPEPSVEVPVPLMVSDLSMFGDSLNCPVSTSSVSPASATSIAF
jgi:hypothetical protein